MSDAYAGTAAFVWVWILGTATYYLIPSIGPFHVAPGDFAGLAHSIIQETQARYLHQRAMLLAHPQEPGAFAQLAAFASLHVSVTVVILGLGWHFALDVPAGLMIGALAWRLGPRTVGVRRRPPPSRPLPSPPSSGLHPPPSNVTDMATPAGAQERSARRRRVLGRVRFVVSWSLGIAVLGWALPRLVDVHGVVAALGGVRWPQLLVLALVWLLGLLMHTVVLTAAAPDLTHRRALTLNMTGSAVANVLPLGGAAGVELNRRMMRAWGIDVRTFTGYTVLTNLWDVAAKLVLPVIAVGALARAGDAVTLQLQDLSLLAAVLLALVVVAVVVVLSRHGTDVVGAAVERVGHTCLRLVGRDRPLRVAAALRGVRRECLGRITTGWVRMTAGITGYVALQWVLLALCLHVTAAHTTWPQVLAAFAVERLLTVIPLTPGGIGIADLGLVGVLLTFGGDPARVAAAAVLYRLFTFVLEIPVGGGVLGAWLLARRRSERLVALARLRAEGGRVAHVTDVFLPRLGGIETHVDDLVRHQRAAGIDAHVLTPTRGGAEPDPPWVFRLSPGRARAAVAGYDTVHVHVSVWSPYGVSVARAAMAAGIPTLVTVHSMWAPAGGLLRVVGRTPLRRWPVVWSAVSGAAADAFRRSLGDAEVAVLPDAIPVGAWRPTDESPSPVPASTTPISLISVMRLTPRKRPLQLVRAFAQVRQLTPGREVRLVIVGDGPLRRRLDRLVRRLGLTESVRVTGRLPRTDVLGELRAAAIYVAPAAKEAFGIAALEARAAGLPVVADLRGGVREFVRDGVDGVLVGGDVHLVTALAQLVTDPVLRERITEHNRRVPPAHDWSDALDRTDALYALAADRVAVAHTPVAVPAPGALSGRVTA